MPRLGRIKKPNLNQRLLQMTIKRFQLIRSNRLFIRIDDRRLFNRPPLLGQPSHAHLVSQHLHSRRQIQRAERRIRGNVHMIMTALQLLIGQAGIFTAKHQRHLRTLLRLLARGNTTLAWLQHRPGNVPIPRTGTHY